MVLVLLIAGGATKRKVRECRYADTKFSVEIDDFRTSQYPLPRLLWVLVTDTSARLERAAEKSEVRIFLEALLIVVLSVSWISLQMPQSRCSRRRTTD